VDAFPGKEFSGIVISKANIGEQVRNFDTKVFEVVVLLHSIDSLLRPAMTTGLNILVDSISSSLQIPLEAIQVDSVSFVYKKTKSGFVRQEVVTGPSNDMAICIALGLSSGDHVSMNAPEGGDKLEFIYLDAGEKKSARDLLDKALADRNRIQQELAKTIKADNASQDQSGGSTIFIF
jgi:hypothetical protein